MTQERQLHYPHSSREEMSSYLPKDAQKILDVGCNSGAFGEKLKAQKDIEVWGVEPDPIAAAEAREVLDQVINSHFDEYTNLPDGAFDAVVFNDVLEHLADPWRALRLTARKLRPTGVVVASIPNFRQIDNLMHILLECDFHYEDRGIRDSSHLRFFTRKSILRLFEETSYRVEVIEGINEDWWSPSLPRRLMFRIFNKYLEETKFTQFAVLARPIGRGHTANSRASAAAA